MAFCEFCKAEGQKTGTCAYCGTVYYTAGVTFIYGQTEKDSYGSEIRISDKYLIVRSVSNAEMLGNVTAGAAMGLVGALTASAVDAMRTKTYAFYDLQDLEKVIYPYHTKAIKKDTAFKFVNKDGSDFILYFNLNGMFCNKAAKGFATALQQIGLYVESGYGVQPSCCVKPFVDKATFATRVCRSAAVFVKMGDKQFIAPTISNASQPVQQPIYQAPVEPVQQPIYQAPMEPVQQQVYQAPAEPVQQPIYQSPQQPVSYVYQPPVQEVQSAPVMDSSAWQSAWQTSAAPSTPAESDMIMCTSCGTMNSSVSRFCSRCGTPTENNTQPSYLSADAWKSKW